ncbi:hypothetical protein D7Y13_35120 [Corallococcus praedator]|uniref:Uncharacterized protein n=1 Tax=Corallococcus praedator TaxID=2316724 RepID=A0ABX9Q868_9BACT|nr:MULTISPECIES: hypothetical protein [Corallococcus]RKH28913.1 hypothetical protein D7X75_23880 [Corallococcus sp. CA031C]RKH92915.1 hypothetical protein D7Y13_35120 [Corallococcus praedator]
MTTTGSARVPSGLLWTLALVGALAAPSAAASGPLASIPFRQGPPETLSLRLNTGNGKATELELGAPTWLRLNLALTATWRRYCSRPGVEGCGAFERLPEDEQVGDTSDFSSSQPYLGLALELEILPLAQGDSSVLRGLGLQLGAQRGFSTSDVTLTGDGGQTPVREVTATDTAFTAQALYRFYFRFGTTRPQQGYVGARAGLQTRAFDVEEATDNPLSGTHRVFPSVALDLSVPLFSSVRLDASGGLLLSPKPGRSPEADGGRRALEISDFGTSVSSFGWSAELGVSGEIWGPFGYDVAFRLAHFRDQFSGAGTLTGWADGGVAEETYSSLHAGLTASY